MSTNSGNVRPLSASRATRPGDEIEAYALLWWVMGLLVAVLIVAVIFAI